jgi:hypothetical protein
MFIIAFPRDVPLANTASRAASISSFEQMARHYLSRYGVVVGEGDVLVHVRMYSGTKGVASSQGYAIVKQFRPDEERVLAQLVVEDASPWQRIPKDLAEVAAPGTKVRGAPLVDTIRHMEVDFGDVGREGFLLCTLLQIDWLW